MVCPAVPRAGHLGGGPQHARHRPARDLHFPHPGHDRGPGPAPLRQSRLAALSLHPDVYAARGPRDPDGHQPAHGVRRRRHRAGDADHHPGPRDFLRQLCRPGRPGPAPGFRLHDRRGGPGPRRLELDGDPPGPAAHARPRAGRRGPDRLHPVGGRLRHHFFCRRPGGHDVPDPRLQHDQARRHAADQCALDPVAGADVHHRVRQPAFDPNPEPWREDNENMHADVKFAGGGGDGRRRVPGGQLRRRQEGGARPSCLHLVGLHQAGAGRPLRDGKQLPGRLRHLRLERGDVRQAEGRGDRATTSSRRRATWSA